MYPSEYEKVTIPFYISKYGLISIQLLLILSVASFLYKHYFLSILLGLLYGTSIIYWCKLHLFSILKCVDVFLGILAFSIITFYYSPKYFKPAYTELWNNFIFFTAFIVLFNEYIYYRKCIDKNSNSSNFHLYPLVYEEENTKAREFEHYRVVFTHCLFIHCMPVIVGVYCFYKSFN